MYICKTELTYRINLTEILKIFEKDGWVIVDTCLKAKAEQLSSETPFAEIKKGNFDIEVPFADIARVIYEMLSPKVLIDTYNAQYNKEPQECIFSLTNYTKESSLWD
jgi:hypothetical protein